MLPDGDGTSLLEHIRRNLPEIRVTVTTGVVDNAWLKRAQDLGPACILSKPIDFNKLLNHL